MVAVSFSFSLSFSTISFPVAKSLVPLPISEVVTVADFAVEVPTAVDVGVAACAAVVVRTGEVRAAVVAGVAPDRRNVVVGFDLDNAVAAVAVEGSGCCGWGWGTAVSSAVAGSVAVSPLVAVSFTVAVSSCLSFAV